MRDSMVYFTFYSLSFLDRSLTATVKSRDGNRESGTNQTCSLDSYLSTNAGPSCPTYS